MVSTSTTSRPTRSTSRPRPVRRRWPAGIRRLAVRRARRRAAALGTRCRTSTSNPSCAQLLRDAAAAARYLASAASAMIHGSRPGASGAVTATSRFVCNPGLYGHASELSDQTTLPGSPQARSPGTTSGADEFARAWDMLERIHAVDAHRHGWWLASGWPPTATALRPPPSPRATNATSELADAVPDRPADQDRADMGCRRPTQDGSPLRR